VRGVVFDLDGTLVDNMELHARAFAAFADRHGLPPLDERARARLDGKRNSDIFPELFGHPLPPEQLRAFAEEKESLYREISRGRLVPAPGLAPLLDRLLARGIPFAVATSGPAANVRHTLLETGLFARLDVIVRGDQVPRGKPHPDIFLAAAAQMRVEPSRCLAFEDSPAGVASACAAGMPCIALTTSFTPEAFRAAGVAPDGFVPDFAAFLDGPGRSWLPDVARPEEGP
jgi:HAD superfamily hydrolase (TIGR01509 family)